MPKPKPTEDEKTYMARCMGDAGMLKECPTPGQRAIVCAAHWDKRNMAQETPDYLFYLSAPSTADATPALVMDTMPKEVNGIPAFYFWRQSVSDGTYVHPTKKFSLTVDEKRRKALEANFREMRWDGVPVPIVKDHKEISDNTVGFVVDVRQRGGWLEELHQYLGEKNRDTALTNFVSVGIDPHVENGRGRVFGEAIRHSAITPIPVVTGQGCAIAASQTSGPASALFLTLAATEEVFMTLTPEQVVAVKDCIGGDAEVTADTGFDMLLGWSHEIKKKMAAAPVVAAATAEQAKALSAATAELATLKPKLAEAEGKVLTLSAASKPPDAEVIEGLAEVDESGLQTCVDRGAITPAVCAKLKSVLIGTKGNRSTMLFSRAAVEGAEAARITRLVIEALKDNKPIQPGTRTGVQELSAAVAAADKKPSDANPILDRAEATFGKKP